MKNKVINIIIIATLFSLIGLIFMQLYWMRNSMNVAEDQFNHRVTLALEKVLDEIQQINEQKLSLKLNLNDSSCIYKNLSKKNFPDSLLIDSLLGVYAGMYNLDLNYFFKIIPCDSVKSKETLELKNISEDIFLPKHKTCLNCLWNEECFNLELYFPDKTGFITSRLSLWFVFSILFLLVVIVSFIYIVRNALRQKKNSEIKNDFVNNMTHEFKTPISTISIASEVLINSVESSSFEKVKQYSKVIFNENLRLKAQVERVLQVATMDKGDVEMNLAEIDLHLLIQETITNLCLEQFEKKVEVEYDFVASNSKVYVDIMHVTNVIINLVDNSIKYSNEEVKVVISTENVRNGILISFKDNGIGMSKEKINNIFEKFYRVHTGNIHNVKGFGLGLYYVKEIINSHQGNIKVKSELNIGSEFSVFLPFTPVLSSVIRKKKK